MKQGNIPLVTIVTITFNLINAGREKYFRQCLESVHNQTYKNIEHIVVDGASDDGTVNLIKEYVGKEWIKYISEKDSGIYDAMNKGIKMANGKYIAFLNSDDFYHNEDAVKLSLEYLEKNDADFSYANYIQVDKNKKEVVKSEIEKFLYTMPFGHPTMFIKTFVIREENGFNEKYSLPADYDLVIRLILKDYKSIYVDREIVSYRTGGFGCTVDHSSNISEIYCNNYSSFYSDLTSEQAKKIMYELKLPDGFIANFRDYANKRQYKNINIEKVIMLLLNNLSECMEKNEHSDKKFENGIPVFLSSDNNYAPFVATTVASIMDHTDSYVNFYILDGGISFENARKIRSLKKNFPNCSIEFIEINTRELFKDFPERLHFSIDMYTRFLIPDLKPDLKKVIYSDVDVIFNDNIEKLFNEDLGSFALGAVPYTFGYLNPDKQEINSYHKRLKLSDDHKYFESGLLLINVDLWKKNNLTQKLINEVKNNPPDIILTPDQDVFNIVFENNYKQLGNKYIVVPYREKIMRTDLDARESCINPFIIHYAGSDKPWKKPSMAFSYLFWNYARITSFYEELIFKVLKTNNNTLTNYEIKSVKTESLSAGLIMNKILFAILSPKKFTKKYINIILNSRLRQLVRKIWYRIRFKKIP